MSVECSECEHDLRAGHDPECSRDPWNMLEYAASYGDVQITGMGELWQVRWLSPAPQTEESVFEHKRLVVAVRQARDKAAEWVKAQPEPGKETQG